MKRRKYSRNKYYAILAIYLIISLTFFTARVFAVLNYDISGNSNIPGYASSNGDSIMINVTADSNVSFVTTSGSYQNLPLLCGGNAGIGSVFCSLPIDESDLNTNLNIIPFMLQQLDGNPISRSGTLYIDSMAPVNNTLTVTKTGDGLLFTYVFTDYLASTSETFTGNNCLGSGIGHIEFRALNKVVSEDITTKNCTVSGEKFINLSNTYNDQVIYSVIVRDRVGNEFNTGPVAVGGDFRPPNIGNTFKIIRNGVELTSLSSNADTIADVVVQVEDTNLSQLEGDLTNLNINPKITMNPDFINAKASCSRVSGNLYNCTFTNVDIKPGSSNLQISFTATDTDENVANKVSTDVITLQDSAGNVLYLGPMKTHCTSDLQSCYLRSGMQILQVELDTTSSYNNSIIHIGANSDNRFAICKLENVWRCTGTYTVPSDINNINLVIAPSSDDYGNIINSGLSRDILIDNDPPINISAMTSVNNNNNNNCSLSGDTLTFDVQLKDTSPELKMYLNTSQFTTREEQNGSCTPNGDNTFDCILAVKDFSSIPTSISQNITIEDLAGNILHIPYTFDVCKSTSSAIPNVITAITQDKTNIPSIDRRTASYLSVKTYIPLNIVVQNGNTPTTLMYLSVDKCTAKDSYGLDVIGSDFSLIPSYGNNPIMILNIGNGGAKLPENELNINCTISARVKAGSIVFLQPEKQDFTVTVKTYNNSLGSIDTATNDEINTVKQHLRDVDKEIKNRKKVDDILGNMCKIAQGIGDADTVLQAAKAVLYGVLIIISQIPGFGDGVGQGLWTTVQTTMGQMHNFVIKWIWPPGLLPKSGQPKATAKLGSGAFIKYTCTVYTCKQLDVGTYTGLIVELGATGLQNLESSLNSIAKSGTSGSGSSVVQSGYQSSYGTGGKGPTDQYGNEIPQSVEITAHGPVGTPSAINPSSSSTSVSNNPQPVTFEILNIVGITTNDNVVSQAPPTPININTKSISVAPPLPGLRSPYVNNQKYLTDTTKYMSSALNNHQWIVNPYTSIHYDDTCNPAIIYNLKKDRQISCMYLNCLENQVAYGLPKIICDGNYKINKCLYLDSADYVLNGRGSAINAFWRGLTSALKASALGMAIQFTYIAICPSDYLEQGYLKDVVLKTGGFHSAFCGVTGSVLAVKEISDFLHNPFNDLRTMDPAANKDYCKGLDYSEATETNTGGNLGYIN